MPSSELIHLENVGLAYPTASGPYPALANLNLTISAGEHVAIVGRSGSGKSSLLNLITGIDRPSQGRVVVEGTEVASLEEGPLALWRGRTVGIVFQFFQLIPTLTVLENLLLPMESSTGRRAPRAPHRSILRPHRHPGRRYRGL
jgi:putative ABC transport system ATP-binding protein